MTITATPKIVLIQRFYFFIIALLTPFLVQIDAFAQTNPELGFPLITNYSPKTYKGHGQVWSVIQDDKGVMYFGTTSGITAYDGVNWSQVKITGINRSGSVRALERSINGTIFYGGAGSMGYLRTLENGKTEAISLTEILPEENRDFSQIWSIRCIGKYVYFQAREFIFRIEENSERQDLGIKVWGSETGFAFSHAFGDQYFVSQVDKGVFTVLGEELTLVPDGQAMADTRVYIMLPIGMGSNENQTYLVGTFNKGFFKYDGKKFSKFATEIDPILKDRFPYRGIVLPDGNFLVSIIGEGAIKITPQGKYLQSISLPSGLQDPSVYALYRDNSDMVWTGLDNGISKIDLRSPVTVISKQLGLNAGVLSIERSNGTLYIGTPTGTYNFNKSKRQFEFLPNTSISQIFSLKSADDYLLVPGSEEVGVVYFYNSKSNKLDGRIKSTGMPNYFYKPKNHSERIFYSSNTGIGILKRTPNEVAGLPYFHEGFIQTGVHTIWSIAEDNEGNFWGGTQSGLAYRIKLAYLQDGTIDFENYKIDTFGEENGLANSNGVVYGIAGKIYTISEDGLLSFNPSISRFEKDEIFGNIKIDFSSTDNFTMAEDNQGRVWIGTNQKITLATPTMDGGYLLEDGLYNSYPFDDITVIYPEDDGTVWVGNYDGLVRMEENREKKDQNLFSVLLRQSITKRDTLNVIAPKGFSLENNNNSLRFTYAAPFYEQEERTSYQTFLEGFDPDWTDWGNNSYKEYTNLPSGTYTFRVRAKNLYNVISDEATYTFTILPPWYATWWSYLVYLLILGFLIFLIDRFQRRRLLAKLYTQNREKELAQAKEIQKAYENLKSTQEQLIQQEKLASLGQLTAGIAHEIKNPLNFVNNFSELSMEYIEEIFEEMEKLEQSDVTDDIRALLNDVKSNLSKILQHGSRADGIVKSMLMHSRGGKGIMEPTDLNELVKEYVNLAFHGMRANKNPINVDIKLQLDENLPKVKINPEDFSRVILNLCKNAFDAMRDKTYENPNGYLPKLTVRTKDLDDNLILEVEDNGPGIAEEFRDKLLMPFFTTKKGTEGTGLGLSITHDIVKAHEGTLEINSEVGNFTRFSIMLKKE